MALKEQTEFGSARQMITEDEDFSLPESQELLRIDIACGRGKQEGFKGIDKADIEGIDIVHDLFSFPWPLESNSVYEFFCSHFVEHIPHDIPGVEIDGLNRFMEEVYRCLMPGGTIKIQAPFYTSVRAWQDPTHRRAITDLTFSYFSQEHMRQVGIEHYSAKCDFEILSRTFILNNEWEFKSEEAKRFAMRHYWNVVDDIVVMLRKK